MSTNYKILCKQLEALIEDESHFIPNMANASALLFTTMKDLNWAGFYLMNEGELMLGPFQGNTACIRIKLGKGVCGTAARDNKTMVVEDVHQFEGHIACDCASNSEIVVPIHKDGQLFGVLDIDSPKVGRFGEEDAKGLEEFVAILEKKI